MIKKAKMILITTGACLLVATSVAITIPSILVSSNSDAQDVKDAKMALEKLTPAQKTVDLTNDANQKLPSEIAPTIKSIKSLSALIKGVIIISSGVAYTPNVVEIDNDKKELVIEIEIKKGLSIDTLKFVVTGFKILTKKDLNKEAKGLIKANFYYEGKAFDLAKGALFYVGGEKAMHAAPKANYIIVVSKVEVINETNLKILYTLRKDGKTSDQQIFIYSNFKKQAVIELNKKAAALTQDNFTYNDEHLNLVREVSVYTDHTKVAAISLGDDIILVASAIQVNGVVLEITYTLTQNGETSDPQTFLFKYLNSKIIRAALNLEAKNLAKDNLHYDKKPLDFAKVASVYTNHTKISGVSFLIPNTILQVSAAKASGTTLTISYILRNGVVVSTLRTLKLSGFKLQAYLDIDVQLEKIENSTIIGDKNKLPSQMTTKLIEELASFPKETKGVHFSVISKTPNNEGGTLVITLKAIKGEANTIKEITISGFQTQAQASAQVQANIITVNTELAKILNGTIKGDENKLPSEMTTELIKVLASFPKETKGVHFNVILIKTPNNEDGTLVITLKAIKGEANTIKEITISGFQTQAQQAQNDINGAKIILRRLGEVYFTIIKVTTKINDLDSNNVKYENLDEFLEKTDATLTKDDRKAWDKFNVDINFEIDPYSNYQEVTINITKEFGQKKKCIFRVEGFKKNI